MSILVAMPLSQLTLSAKLTWSNTATPTGTAIGYSGSSQGPNTNSFSFSSTNLASLLTAWTNVYAADFVVFVTAPSGLNATLQSGGTLTVSTTYYYKITGTGGNQETGGSNEVSATPTSGNQSIKLSWPQLQGATGYKVYRGTSAGSENLLVGTVTSGSTLTFTDTGFAGSAGSVPSSPNNYVEFSLSSFTNLVGETVAPGHALGLIVLPSGINAQCQLSPGASNGLVWFFGGTNPGINIPITASSGNGGLQMLFGPSDYAGQVIDGTHNTLRVTNGGTGNLSATVGVIVGP